MDYWTREERERFLSEFQTQEQKVRILATFDALEKTLHAVAMESDDDTRIRLYRSMTSSDGLWNQMSSDEAFAALKGEK